MRKVYAYGPDGNPLAIVPADYPDRHPQEAVLDGGVVRLRPSAAKPIRALTNEEKRRLELARQRAGR